MNPKDMTNEALLNAWLKEMKGDYEHGCPCETEFHRRLDEIDALRKENEELRKDKERLDWLAHETFLPVDCPTTGVFAVVCEDVAPLGTFGDFGKADELAFRAVIDAAKAKESEASHEI